MHSEFSYSFQPRQLQSPKDKRSTEKYLIRPNYCTKTTELQTEICREMIDTSTLHKVISNA